MKYFIALIGCFMVYYTSAQVADDFSDGDFINDPAWSGTDDFDASGQSLRLAATAAGESYLSTPQTPLGATTWEFYFRLAFSPSANNQVRIYLASDQANLGGSLNGYYFQVGQTGSGDVLNFYQQDDTDNHRLLFSGTTSLSSSFELWVQVTRDEVGNWQVNASSDGLIPYTSEGPSFAEATFSAATHVGFWCKYSVGNRSNFYFDEVRITTAVPAFGISLLTEEDDNSIRVHFNQNVDEATAETVSNYIMNYAFGNPVSAKRDLTNHNEVLLTFASDFANNDYTLTIDLVKNEAQDETIDAMDRSFEVERQTPFRKVVINEIMADPSPSAGLPSAEYIELYNTSDKAINIGNFMIDARTISHYVIEPNAYVILTTAANAPLFSGHVIGLSGLSLSNGGEGLELTDNLGNLVDSVTYSPSWYQDTDKDHGGYALEQINPMLTCNHENNWTASEHADGGTPGIQNLVYDHTPDNIGPNLIAFNTTDANTFLVTFDEPMDKPSLLSATYTFDNGIVKSGVSPIGPGFRSTMVDVAPDMTSGTQYTISISGATDCAGNTIQSNSLSVTYDTNPPILDRIVVRNSDQLKLFFNETLARSTAETESNYTSSHSGENPASAVLGNDQATMVCLTFSNDFGLNEETTLTVNNLEDLQGNALTSALTPTFTLSQQIDTVHVMGINLLDVYFKNEIDPSSTTMTNHYVVDDDIGHPITAFLDASNRKLVHLAFAKNFDDNKGLTLSVSDIKDRNLNFLTTPDITFVYDTSPPKLDTVKVVSASSLAVVFTTFVEQHSAESKENYVYDGIYPAEARLAQDHKTVILSFSEKFQREVVFELSIDEVKDRYGNKMKTKLKQAFTYDIFGPQLDSIIVRSSKELILWFNENLNHQSAETTANYAIGNSLDHPTSAQLNTEYPHIVYLNLASELPESAGIGLNISSMTDARGNSIESSLSSTFDYELFYLSSITPRSASRIEIEFNKVPSATEKNALSNYKLNGNMAEAIAFSSDRIALITFGTNMEDGENQELVIENTTDSNANPIAFTNYSFEFDSGISSASLIGDRSVELVFEVKLNADQILSPENFSATPSLGKCVAAIIDKDDSHILRFTFQQALIGDVYYEIEWKNLTNLYENRLPDYFVPIVKDETAPTILSLNIIDSHTLWLRYAEALNEVSAEFLNNYKINPDIGHPVDATYQIEDTTVLLRFSSAFSEGNKYELAVDNIKDLSDNALTNYHMDFTYEAPSPVAFSELIITEIMADPTPEVGLPDAEYIEIYNTTDRTISLVGISLVDESGSATLTTGEMAGHSYLILKSHSGVTRFSGLPTLGVTSFPSLKNSGEDLSLYANESQVFSTSYHSDWYKDSDKKAGGWALEMIDVTNPCGEINNWTASIHETGGTPGRPNSVATSNPDNFGPEVVTALAVSDDSVLIVMNEKLYPLTFSGTNITFSPANTVESLLLVSPVNSQIGVSLGEKLLTGQLYEVNITGVADCQRNAIRQNRNSANFRLPEPAVAQDLIINEILFNPKAGGVDFVEIYNKSNKAVNLKNWRLADQMSNTKTITLKNLVINPAEYLVLTPDPAILASNYPLGNASRYYKMVGFPNLADAEDSVILISDNQLIIDEMKYQDDYHFNLLDHDDGVSLERISFDAESINIDSWKSAASTVGFATPGTQNSQFRITNQSAVDIYIEPKVFVPDNTGINDFTTIYFQLDQAGSFANVRIYSAHGVLVKTLAEGELLSTRSFFTWDGITNSGSQASVGYYIVRFEIFDGNGNKSIRHETVVLGSKF